MLPAAGVPASAYTAVIRAEDTEVPPASIHPGSLRLSKMATGVCEEEDAATAETSLSIRVVHDAAVCQVGLGS